MWSWLSDTEVGKQQQSESCLPWWSLTSRDINEVYIMALLVTDALKHSVLNQNAMLSYWRRHYAIEEGLAQCQIKVRIAFQVSSGALQSRAHHQDQASVMQLLRKFRLQRWNSLTGLLTWDARIWTICYYKDVPFDDKESSCAGNMLFHLSWAVNNTFLLKINCQGSSKNCTDSLLVSPRYSFFAFHTVCCWRQLLLVMSQLALTHILGEQ